MVSFFLFSAVFAEEVGPDFNKPVSFDDSLDFEKYHVTIDQDGRGPNDYGTFTPKYG